MNDIGQKLNGAVIPNDIATPKGPAFLKPGGVNNILKPQITTAWWIAKHAEYTKRMTEITIAKNADYSGANNYPFDNFEIIEKLGIAKTEVGFLTRMMDKMSRISCILQTGVQNVKDETIEDTLLDLANYSLLLAGYLESKR